MLRSIREAAAIPNAPSDRLDQSVEYLPGLSWRLRCRLLLQLDYEPRFAVGGAATTELLPARSHPGTSG
jgi:hypothetical protein